jgi:hypothetical protein
MADEKLEVVDVNKENGGAMGLVQVRFRGLRLSGVEGFELQFFCPSHIANRGYLGEAGLYTAF